MAEKLTKNQWLVLEWLAREDLSSVGECNGPDLKHLIDIGYAQIFPPTADPLKTEGVTSSTVAGRAALQARGDDHGE